MTRTQIQLPDEVYARAKRLCREREISLAELARRGIEHILNVYAPADTPKGWAPPKPKILGFRNLDDEALKAHAQWPERPELEKLKSKRRR
jgi:hypothetical protein